MKQQPIFKALADPTRRAVLRELQNGSRTAGELAELFPITQASLSHHFNLLKNAELIRHQRRGQHIVYSLNTTVMQDIVNVLLELLTPAQVNTNAQGAISDANKNR